MTADVLENSWYVPAGLYHHSLGSFPVVEFAQGTQFTDMV